MDRVTGIPIPRNGGFALVGDSDCLYVLGEQSAVLQDFAGHRQLGVPDSIWIVFNPPGLRINLWEFLLRHPYDGTLCVENNGARTCGSLIKGENVRHAWRSVSSHKYNTLMQPGGNLIVRQF